MGEKISVIIPVYNVAEYLEECLESIINQTYSRLEIIVVDDGSNDGSANICKRYADSDERVRVITQANMGVAMARKAAVKQAQGEYICFVDADDCLECDYYERMIIEMQDVDMVTSGYFINYDKGDSTIFFDKIRKGVYRTNEKLEYVYANMIYIKESEERGLTPYIWNKLYRNHIAREVFDELNTSLFFGEDSDFLYRYVLKCSSIKITNICGYHYRMREQSAIHSTNDKYLQNVSDLYLSLKGVFEVHKQSEVLLKQLQHWIATMIVRATRSMGFSEEFQSTEYIFPFVNMLAGKRIVLYGAGAVGKSYHKQIQQLGQWEEVLWVDKNYDKLCTTLKGISPISKIREVEFDYIIIAVKEENIARNIMAELSDLGFGQDRVLWRKLFVL